MVVNVQLTLEAMASKIEISFCSLLPYSEINLNSTLLDVLPGYSMGMSNGNGPTLLDPPLPLLLLIEESNYRTISYRIRPKVYLTQLRW